jgi:porin
MWRSRESRIVVRRVLTAAAASCLLLAAGVAARADELDLWKREKLSGDWGGVRTALEKQGVEIGINYIGETFSVLSGGLRRGTSYEGRLDAMVETDLEKLFGWSGGKTQVRVFQIHNSGRNAADLVGSVSDPSNIDALATTRLFTAWFQQAFGKAGSVRIGQLAADDEFLTSNTAGGLINGTFGWANIMAANLPSGGAAYPLATPGVRLQLNPTERVSLLAAVLSGDPAGANCTVLPQECNRYGTTFSFSGGAFWIGEAQYQVNQDKDAKGLAAAYKLGVWYHTGDFADQRFGVDPNTGAIVTLASVPAPNPLNHRGNWGVYGVADQMLWRGPQSSASVFARGGIAPSDRNLVSWYVDGGIGIKGPIPGRADDTLTFGVAHSQVSSDAAALDRDTLTLNGAPYPIRNSETVFELSYIVQIAPWWSLQPDIQYILRPGGNAPDPDDPNRSVGNALVIGARSTMTF